MMIKLTNISDTDIKQNGVQALANRPNAPAKYGIGGLTPNGLKQHFDKLASLLADKINDLQDALSSEDAASYICLPLFDRKDDKGNMVEGSLADLVASFKSGVFASTCLYLLSSVSGETRETLQTVINGIAASIAKLEENSGTEIRIAVDDAHVASIGLYNKDGTLLAEQKIDLKTSEGHLIDGAVTTDKIEDGNVTTPKLAQEAVTTEKLAPVSVTTPKIAGSAVTNEKIAPAAVSTEKIANQNITTEKLADAAVTGEKLADAGVTTDKIENGAVTDEKISDDALGEVVKGVDYDGETHTFTFTMRDGTTKNVDLPLEGTVKEAKLDQTNDNLVLTFTNGDTTNIPLANLTASLKESINTATQQAEKATKDAKTAATSATAAANSAAAEAKNASDARAAAEQFVSDAKETMDAAIDEFTNYQAVKTINGGILRFFVGTQAEYNALPDAEKVDLFSIFTDDKTLEEIEAKIAEFITAIAALEKKDTAHDEAITALEEKDTAHDEAITALEEKDTAHDEAITALETRLTYLGFKEGTVRCGNVIMGGSIARIGACVYGSFQNPDNDDYVIELKTSGETWFGYIDPEGDWGDFFPRLIGNYFYGVAWQTAARGGDGYAYPIQCRLDPGGDIYLQLYGASVEALSANRVRVTFGYRVPISEEDET